MRKEARRWRARVHDHVVEHDVRWTYKGGDVPAETVPIHEAARRAARVQRVPTDCAEIEYEDAQRE